MRKYIVIDGIIKYMITADDNNDAIEKTKIYLANNGLKFNFQPFAIPYFGIYRYFYCGDNNFINIGVIND